MPGEVLTAPETAAMLGVSLSALRRWCDGGKGPPCWRTPGGQRRFERERVLEWVASRQQADEQARKDR